MMVANIDQIQKKNILKSRISVEDKVRKTFFFMGVNFSKRRQPPSAAPRINAVWNEY